MTPTEVLNTVFSGVTAFALVIGVIQLLFHSRQMHRDFELLYVQRYWDLMDRRSKKFAIRGVAKHKDLSVIHGYLQLCEDELDLRRLGRVTDNTWGFWSRAITDQCSAPGYRDVLEEASAEQWPMLQRHIAPKGRRDPLGRGWFWRKWHGL